MSFRTERSTTIASCGKSSRSGDTVFRLTATPRFWFISTKSTVLSSRNGFAGCSRLPSGTNESGAWSSLAIGSESSLLYYRLTADSLSFASELKALLRQPDFSREIDLDALEAFLAFSFVPAPMTIFTEARKLLPGHVLVWEERRGGENVRIQEYARPAAVPAESMRTENEETLAVELLDRLRDSVRAHLIADVPVGVLLSGGVDSAALTALAAEESSGPVSTFTIGFDERHFDEREPARLISERYGTDHHELVLRPDAVELLPALAEVYDEPFSDGSAIPTYLVSQLARQNVKVALSGEGGDEFFGGYNYYVGHRLAPLLGPISAPIRFFAERLPTSTAKSSTFDHRVKRFARSASLPTLERHYRWKTITPLEEREELILPERRGSQAFFDLLADRFAASKGVDDLARVMDLDIGIFLVDDMLARTDRASMAHSLETRVPVLDPVISELAFAVPSHMKVRRFQEEASTQESGRTAGPGLDSECREAWVLDAARGMASRRAQAHGPRPAVGRQHPAPGLLPTRGRSPVDR